ncbi:MAG TPA: adenylyltransferase/cytidyltransferase family protein, partial [bacterium]|nr:adenylyltransferase/cytidyltransferase family protein [bacterium]
IRCLQKAKKAGDILVVGLNSDASVRKLKGPERPFLPEKERAEILSALEAVDYVVLFHDLTPIKLIKALQPDVLVKGAEYRDREVVGASLVRSYGGRILLVPMVPGSSTSILAARIRQKKVRKGKK